MAQGTNETSDGEPTRWFLKVVVGNKTYDIGVKPELTREGIDKFLPVVVGAVTHLLEKQLEEFN